MSEESDELEQMMQGTPVEVERPWLTPSDRSACWGFTAILVLGGPIQLYFASSWWARVLAFIFDLWFGWGVAASAWSGRDYFRFPLRRPLVAPDLVAEWEAALRDRRQPGPRS